MTYNELLNQISTSIIPGLAKGVTAEKLKSLFDNLAQFANETRGDYQGPAAPADDPGTPTDPVYYIATTDGTYTNFGGLTVTAADGLNLISYVPGTGWTKTVVPIDLSGYATNVQLSEKATNSEIRDLSYNIVDPSGIEDGSINSSTGLETGNTDYYRSDFIPISGSDVTTYSCRWIWFYDISKAYIPGSFDTVSSDNVEKIYSTVSIPVSAAYCRVVSHDDQDQMMVILGTENPPYEDFGYQKIKQEVVPELDTDNYKNESISPEKTVFFDSSLNLIDPDLPSQSIGIIVSGTGAINTSNTDYMTTGYVPILPNTIYTISSGNFAGFYDTLKNYIPEDFISGGGFDGNGIATFTSSPTAYFIKISSTTSRFPTVMIQVGASFTGYVPFSDKRIKQVYLPNTVPININLYNRFYGSKSIAYGDSLIANDYFMLECKNDLAWNWTNKGVGGEKSYEIVKRLIDDISLGNIDLSDTDLLILCCGTNDRTSGTPIGSFGETWDNITSSNNSFTCALEEAIRQVFTVNKNISMVLFTPQKRTDGGTSIWDGPNTSTGLYTKDYRDRMLEVGEKWSIPIIDFFLEGQKNQINAVDLTTNGDTVHPNFEEYGPRLGKWVKNKLNLIP